MTIRFLSALAGIAAFVAAGVPASAGADALPCRAARVIVYAQTDWLRAATELAANASPCAEYYISVPPLAADKTQPRANQASQIRSLGANFHALDEVNYSGWAASVTASGGSWFDAGVTARQRMATAGFDVGAGDGWLMNELSSAVRKGTGTARRSALDFLRGLANDGVKGVVLTAGVSQSTPDLSLYKVNLQDWLQDSGFWTEVAGYAGDWAQESYGDVRRYAVSGVVPADRSASLAQYLSHENALALAGGGASGSAEALLAQISVPFGSAAWSWSDSYGFTAAPVETMEDFVSGQVYAARALGAAAGASTDRIGFAWSPSNTQGLSSGDFNAATKAILDRIAAAIHDTDVSSDPPGAAACLPNWCATAVDGASLTTSWQGFTSWSPTVPAITSTPLAAVASQVAGPLTVQLQTLGLVDNAVAARTVTVSSSAVTGSFATSSAGPWTPTLALTVAPGTSTVAVYYLDSIPGTPTLTATLDGGAAAAQQATIAAAAAPTPPVSTPPVVLLTGPAPTPIPPPVAPVKVPARISSVRTRVVGRHVLVSVRVTAGTKPATGARVKIRIRRGPVVIATIRRTTGANGTITWRSPAPVRRGTYSATAGVLR